MVSSFLMSNWSRNRNHFGMLIIFSDFGHYQVFQYIANSLDFFCVSGRMILCQTKHCDWHVHFSNFIWEVISMSLFLLRTLCQRIISFTFRRTINLRTPCFTFRRHIHLGTPSFNFGRNIHLRTPRTTTIFLVSFHAMPLFEFWSAFVTCKSFFCRMNSDMPSQIVIILEITAAYITSRTVGRNVMFHLKVIPICSGQKENFAA